jgi:quinol-cytochrome oxidoreductase complex cytochrome b subunit
VDAGRDERWRTAIRVCLALLGVTIAVLAATGIWLWFRYVPTAARGWPHPAGGSTSESWVQVTHRVASWIAIALGVVTLVLLIGRRVASGGRGIVAGLGLGVTVAAASFTGFHLAWDQLALWAVTVGNDMRGVQAIFDARVKYVLLGSREVSPGTYRFWAIAHVVFGVLVCVALVLAWLRTRPDRPAVPISDDPELVAIGQE